MDAYWVHGPTLDRMDCTFWQVSQQISGPLAIINPLRGYPPRLGSRYETLRVYVFAGDGT
jgi:hypothetical protein